jgi:hypothetical protein
MKYTEMLRFRIPLFSTVVADPAVPHWSTKETLTVSDALVQQPRESRYIWKIAETESERSFDYEFPKVRRVPPEHSDGAHLNQPLPSRGYTGSSPIF